MSFAPLLVYLPQIIQAIDAVDDLVVNMVERMNDEPDLDPKDKSQLAIMLQQKEASTAKRNAAIAAARARLESDD